MLKIHHLNESRSQRVIWAAEELGIDYEIIHYTRDKKTFLAPDSLRQVHPLGKAPLVETNGKIIAETGAILETIAAGHALRPAIGTPQGDAVTYWLHYSEGSAMPPLVMAFLLCESPKGVTKLVRPLVRMVTRGFNEGYLNGEIEKQVHYSNDSLKSGWFAGDTFTLADIMMSFPLEMIALRYGTTDLPHVSDWLGRIHTRTAYRRALKAGGPYTGAGAI